MKREISSESNKRLLLTARFLAVALLMSVTAYPQAGRTHPQAMAKWVGKYPDAKFLRQPLIRRPLRRILTKADYDSIRDHNLMGAIERVGDYLVTHAQVKYSDPLETFSLVFNLKDGAVYVIFGKGEQHRKFSTMNNQFNLPDDVLKKIGLIEE